MSKRFCKKIYPGKVCTKLHHKRPTFVGNIMENILVGCLRTTPLPSLRCVHRLSNPEVSK